MFITSKSLNSYKDLTPERLINLAIDYVKVSHPLPAEIKYELEKLGLLHLIEQKRSLDEEEDN